MDIDSIYMQYREQLEMLLHVLIALVLGGTIGLERELKKRPAGFRTHMLVAASATMLTDLATVLIKQTEFVLNASLDAVDPIRVIVAIVTGISFLGAGTIFRGTDGVSGLTTAATLLIASVLGITVALEQYVLAVGVTCIVLAVVHILGGLGERINERTDESAPTGTND